VYCRGVVQRMRCIIRLWRCIWSVFLECDVINEVYCLGRGGCNDFKKKMEGYSARCSSNCAELIKIN
jgi:hypothetical protein